MAATIGTGELLKGRYRLERMLGRGGMAAVWLGHDEVLDRSVAVKVLSDTIAGDPGFVARFRREAQTAAALSHPNLVGVYDYSEEGERPYLVMQFVPGEDLAARQERGAELDCDQLARELLEAVDHIHSAGILHRDIKPANVIVEPDGTAKLIDFGIALPRDATALTSTGLILGTERYAAPEVMEGRAATERSDLYSAGVVLGSCRGSRSQALDRLIERMTDRDPGGRPASARQALAELERSPARQEPTRAFEPTFARQRPEPPAAPARTYGGAGSRGGRWGAAAAILGVIAAVIVVALVVLGGDGGSDSGEPLAGGASKQGSTGRDPGTGAAGGAGEAEGGAAAAEAEGEAPTEASGGGAAEAPVEASPAAGPVDAAAASQPGGDDPSRGVALNEEGYALIRSGDYEAAVPVLEEAVAEFPEGSEDLDYAYALFNLGNALRLSGRADEAIPILERRLAIPDQTATVERELSAARAEAG